MSSAHENLSYIRDISDLDCDENSRKLYLATLNQKIKDEVKPTNGIFNFWLWKFAKTREIIQIITGTLLAFAASFGLAASIWMFADIASLMVDRTLREGTSSETHILYLFGGGRILTNATKAENYAALQEDAISFLVAAFSFAILQMTLIAISIDFMNRASFKQIFRIKQRFLRSIITQDMSWYDLKKNDNPALMLASEFETLREGIGKKVSLFVYFLFSFILCFIGALYESWKLSLVVMGCAPFVIIAQAVVTFLQTSLGKTEMCAYSEAGAIAEEVFNSIRTVASFGGELKEVERYRKSLRPTELSLRKGGIYSGISEGLLLLFIFSIYSIGYWYGTVLILDDRSKGYNEYNTTVMLVVLFSVISGSQYLGFTFPQWEALTSARSIAQKVFSVINRKSAIDSLSANGKILLSDFKGCITFEDVHFNYPARKDEAILKGINLSIQPGETVAFVGLSGSGKTTCLQLLQRLYDPSRGQIKLDGINIQELNVQSYRTHIAVVGQEPVLFAMTVAENIRLGSLSATDKQIEDAARIANCHEFIQTLPMGYNTMIGENGGQLSGGQKQRIAIARAIIRNPKILLLDEATSALDTASEKIVQKALESASKGRTTLVVSHRLSTIFNANKIVFVQDGRVAELGTHDQLMNRKGLYYDLVIANEIKADADVRNFEKAKIEPQSDDFSIKDVARTASKPSENSQTDDASVADQFLQVLKLNAPEWPYLLIGGLCAIVCGAAFPCSAILFGDVFGTLSQSNIESAQSQSIYYAILYLLIGIVTGLAKLFQTHLLNLASIQLTTRLRIESFKAFIHQNMSWFDRPENSVGSICSRLSSDCSEVKGATGSNIGVVIQAFSAIIIGTCISFYFSWQLSAVSMVPVILILLVVLGESKYTTSSATKEKRLIENSMKFTIAAISNIKTVMGLGCESYILNNFHSQLKLILDCSKSQYRYSGIVFGLAQTATSIGLGVTLSYGTLLISQEDANISDVLKVSQALLFGTMMMGFALAYTSSFNKAVSAARRIITLLQSSSTSELIHPIYFPYSENLGAVGEINFDKVEFAYPERKEVKVLANFNLHIPKNQTVAIVGPTGCGKSTCIQLLLRYYDPVNGVIKMDGLSTTAYPLQRLRSQIGLVSQEPVLFDLSITENIAYGDNSRNVPMPEIIEAAKRANIHDFIMTLPQAYDTSLGARGAQLSGGQKQRVAIARALIRSPRVLILDEATSALDTLNEKLVQAALEDARIGRICITIAHRLSTIKNSNLICVVQKGTITESGTHEELLQLNGLYAKAYSMQQLIDT